MMEVILLERVEKLGQMGDVVKVKPGYARNYLLPQKMALRATKANLTYFEQQHTQLEATNLERRGEAEVVAGKVEGLTIVLLRQASDMGQLYGSIRPQDIADGVNDAGVTLEHKQVKLDHPIKTIGLHKVRIALHPEVAVEITANVARSEAEAELQAKAGMPVPAPGAETAAGEAMHALRGKVRARTYVGDHNEYLVAINEDMDLRVTAGLDEQISDFQ